MKNDYNEENFPLTRDGMHDLLKVLIDDQDSYEGYRYLCSSFHKIFKLPIEEAKKILPDALAFSIFRESYMFSDEFDTSDIAEKYMEVMFPPENPASADLVKNLFYMNPYDREVRNFYCQNFYRELSAEEKRTFEDEWLWRYWERSFEIVPGVNMDSIVEEMEQDGLLESPDIDVEMLQEDNCFSIDTIAKFVASRLKINLTAIIGRKRYFLKKKKSARSILAYILGFYFKTAAVMEFMTCTEDNYHRMLRAVCNACATDSNTNFFIESLFSEINETWFP